MVMDKKGISTIQLLFMLFFSFIFVAVLGVGIYGFDLVDSAFSEIDFTLGNTTFNDTYNQTLKTGITPLRTTVPLIMSLGVLFGMIIVMMLVGWHIQRISRLWIILDIFIIIIAEILAVVLEGSFTSFINSSPDLLNIFSTSISQGSRFILNLKFIVPIAGVLIMATTYMFSRSRPEEGVEGGF